MQPAILPLSASASGREASHQGCMNRVSQETGSVCAHQPRSRGGTEEPDPMPVTQSSPLHRRAATSPTRLVTLLSILALLSASAHAVILRGTVTDPLGAGIPLAKVELVQGRKVVAFALTGPT